MNDSGFQPSGARRAALGCQSLDKLSLGQPLVELAEATSTNDVLRQMAVAGAAEGTTVVALQQTRGRGRQHRPWHSPPGLGLYLSVLLRPPWPASESGALAPLAGVAVASALKQLGVPDIRLKWPNDVLAGGRKICGVLVEPALKGGQIEFAVVGIGVNVLHGADDFPPELRHTATSCALAGVTVTLAQARVAVLAALDEGYRRALREGPATLYAAWAGAVSS
jgi:BirA family biotin operon repressor/biotin-[acetyl-CoA-carboxylase] ligase